MSLHDVQIRQMDAADAERFSVLRRAVTADNPVPMGLSMDEELSRPMEGFRNQLSLPAPNAAFGAFVGVELLGSAAVAWPSKFASSGHKVNLWGVFVTPSARGHGIGRALVERAISHAFGQGVRRINLQVFVPNAPAVGLYKSLGFAVYGTEPEAVCLSGVYYDGVHMSLVKQGV